MSEHLRIDRTVACDAPHEALHCSQPAEMDGNVGDGSDGDEDAELVDTEPTCEDSEGEELRRRA